MKAAQLGAQQIMLGDAEVVLVGGMENMTRVPFLLPDMRAGLPDGQRRSRRRDVPRRSARSAVRPDHGRDGREPRRPATASRARSRTSSRWRRSRRPSRAPSARAAEIVPGRGHDAAAATVSSTEDEHPRPDTTLETLGKLAPVFREGGSVTAGNSSGITDGGAAMVLMSESRATAEGREPLARDHRRCRGPAFRPRSWGSGRCPPRRRSWIALGCTIDDFEAIEINEAFAAQVIACERELKFDRDRVNTKGGGISLGHPIGMSGARIILSLAYELRAATCPWVWRRCASPAARDWPSSWSAPERRGKEPNERRSRRRADPV